MKTKTEAAKELWAETKDAFLRWWRRKASGGPKDQTLAWAAAVGIPAAALGFGMSPRLTVAACALAWIYLRIKEKTK